MSESATAWTEVRLNLCCTPDKFYEWLDANGTCSHRHHFWEEPWWRWAFVVRLADYSGPSLSECEDVDHFVAWDPSEDEDLYGETWPVVMDLFEASSRLAAAGESLERTEKLIHCVLNARGYDYPDELRYHQKASSQLKASLRRMLGRFWSWRIEKRHNFEASCSPQAMTPGLVELR